MAASRQQWLCQRGEAQGPQLLARCSSSSWTSYGCTVSPSCCGCRVHPSSSQLTPCAWSKHPAGICESTDAKAWPRTHPSHGCPVGATAHGATSQDAAALGTAKAPQVFHSPPSCKARRSHHQRSGGCPHLGCPGSSSAGARLCCVQAGLSGLPPAPALCLCASPLHAPCPEREAGHVLTGPSPAPLPAAPRAVPAQTSHYRCCRWVITHHVAMLPGRRGQGVSSDQPCGYLSLAGRAAWVGGSQDEAEGLHLWVHRAETFLPGLHPAPAQEGEAVSSAWRLCREGRAWSHPCSAGTSVQVGGAAWCGGSRPGPAAGAGSPGWLCSHSGWQDQVLLHTAVLAVSITAEVQVGLYLPRMFLGRVFPVFNVL